MKKKLKIIRVWLLLFMTALILSGVTAFAVETELRWLCSFLHGDAMLYAWLNKVYLAISVNNKAFPALAYGYDWLAFAHIIIAVFFIGPLKDPVRNIWVIKAGCIACVLIFPLAFIAGAVRHIPLFWQLIDCSFGLIGLVPLLICYRKTRWLERQSSTVKSTYTLQP